MSATQIPEMEAGSPQEPRLVLPSRSNPAGAGWDWVVVGWKLFARAPLMWIISVVILFIVAIVFAIVPIIGHLAFQLLQGVIAAGFMVGCHSLARGGDFELEHLLAGFRKNFGSLLLLGLFLVVAAIVIMLVLGMFVGMTVVAAIWAGNSPDIVSTLMASATTMLLGALVALALSVPVLAAYWFAPALVMLNGMSPGAALKESFSGCFKNLLAFLVYGIVMLLAAIVAVIPAGLGMLVWIPVAMASTYAAYRSIFTEPATGQPAVTV